MSSERKYQILSLDGGGSWALLQVMALKEIFQGKNNKDILECFDLVVANSGGSLTLAGMIEKETLDDVLEMYLDVDTRKKIFSKLSLWENIKELNVLRGFKIGPKYKESRKLIGLEKTLKESGKKNLSEIPSFIENRKTDFMIMGFDYDKQRATYFRSNLHSKSASGGIKDDITLAHAVHASSTAPVNYFDEPAKFQYGRFNRRFWDGAVGGNNNPSLVGMVEAIANGHISENIVILSIGTGNNLMPIRGLSGNTNSTHSSLVQKPNKQCLLADISKMTKSILQMPPDAASYMSHIFLGGSALKGSQTNFVRLNPLVQPIWKNKEWNLPEGLSMNDFNKLLNLEMDAVKQSDVKRIQYFGELWIKDQVANQSLRYDETFNPEIGFDKFTDGLKRWKAISNPC